MQNHSLPNRLPADLLPHSNQLNALARLSGFFQRAARKIFPADFLKAVLLTVIEEKPHYRGVATSIAEISSHRPSRQAVGKRLAMPEAAAFLFRVLGEVIARQSTRLVSADRHAGRGLESCRGRFNRVIDEDSTVTPLHPTLAKAFPGARNQHGQCAAIRQRWAYDYLSGQTLDALPGLWSENDPSAAFDLLPLLEENDLVLRDMGYFNLEALNRIGRRKAFYITRLPEGTVIADEQGERIALARLLRRCKGEHLVEKAVRIGAGGELSARLVCLRVDPVKAREKRRQLRARLRAEDRAPTRDQLTLCDWVVVATNVPPAKLGASEVAALYRARWMVEIFFKGLKSAQGMESWSRQRTNPNALQAWLHGHMILGVLSLNLWRAMGRLLAAEAAVTGSPPAEPPPVAGPLKAMESIPGLLAKWLKKTVPKHKWLEELSRLAHYAKQEKRARLSLDQLVWDVLS